MRDASSLSRREAIFALASAATLPLVAGCGRDTAPPATPAASDADALALLDGVADNLLRLMPESATQMGIDTGARAGLRSLLADRSADGQQRIAKQLRGDLDRLNAFNASGLSYATRTSVEVVRSAYRTSLEGFALPYGDITVGGWRNTPYVVIQNVGAYLDIPRFLDSDHQIEKAEDAEAYLERLQSFAKQLDGLERRDGIILGMEQRIELSGVDRVFGKLAFAKLQLRLSHGVIPGNYLHERFCSNLRRVDLGKQPQPLGTLFTFCSFDHGARVSRRPNIRYWPLGAWLKAQK